MTRENVYVFYQVTSEISLDFNGGNVFFSGFWDRRANGGDTAGRSTEKFPPYDSKQSFGVGHFVKALSLCFG